MPVSRRLTLGLPFAGLAIWLAVASQSSGQQSPSNSVPPVLVLNSGGNALHVEPAPVDVGNLLKPLPVHVMGRAALDRTSGAIEHEWPGFYAEGRFRGDTILLRLDDSINRLRITFDDGAAAVIEISRIGRKDLAISGLGDGQHSIRVDKLSESSGPAAFGGFFVRDKADILPPTQERRRLIEFIGDSDTIGYGNMSPTRECSADQVYSATDVSRSFGPRVAARFKADYRLLARSGIGLIRNYGGLGGDAMSALHGRVFLSIPGELHSPEAQADVIVVGVGSNDFSPTIAAAGTLFDLEEVRRDFAPALLALGRERLKRNPGATIIMLAFGEYGDELVAPYREVAAQLRREGVNAELVVLPKLSRRSCHWHPSQADHGLIAGLLETAIQRTIPEWAN